MEHPLSVTHPPRRSSEGLTSWLATHSVDVAFVAVVGVAFTHLLQLAAALDEGYTSGVAHTFRSTATTQSITGLTNGVTYRFWVQAINASGTSAYSKVTNPITPS